jgi:hypothetical protein
MMLDRDGLWPELLIEAAKRARRDELILALLAAVGGFLGVLFAAGGLVWVSAPPPLLRPAEGLMLLARVAVVVPVPAVLGGRLALQLGEQLLRWVRHS